MMCLRIRGGSSWIKNNRNPIRLQSYIWNLWGISYLPHAIDLIYHQSKFSSFTHLLAHIWLLYHFAYGERALDME